MLPELLQLGLDVFLLRSIVCDSGKSLLVNVAALRVAVANLETVFCLARKCAKSSVRGNELHTTMLSLTRDRRNSLIIWSVQDQDPFKGCD